MTTMRTRLLYLLVSFTIGYLPMGALPVAAQDDCKPLLDAESKLDNTPAHVYTTMKIGKETVTSESIYAAGSIYTKINGKWSVTDSIKDAQQLRQDNLRKSKDKVTCRYLKDEPAGGDMAAVYSSHDEGPKDNVDMQMWISKAKGLPLRMETDVATVHSSARFEYGNVKPPL
jgi:outer membrane lipoprotein-sorting protein